MSGFNIEIITEDFFLILASTVSPDIVIVVFYFSDEDVWNCFFVKRIHYIFKLFMELEEWHLRCKLTHNRSNITKQESINKSSSKYNKCIINPFLVINSSYFTNCQMRYRIYCKFKSMYIYS